MEISWGLSKPLQEANLSLAPQETPALPLASKKPDAEWTSTWPFVNPGRAQSGHHHTLVPKENEVFEEVI